MKIEDISNHWGKWIDGHETAYFVLSKHTKEVQGSWKKITLDNRATYFENIILPKFNKKALKDFTMEEVDGIIEEIRKEPTIKTRNTNAPKLYDDDTIDKTIVPCIARLFCAAEQCGICDDIFWEAGRTQSSKRKHNDVGYTRLPKSISIDAEKRLMAALLENVKQLGCTMGIMLMFVFGLRNAEACAAVFGNIIEIGGKHYLCSHSSVDPKKVLIRVGGKTYNMYRIIPIPDMVYEFLMERKQYIQSLIDAGEIQLDPKGKVKNIDQMPIACSVNDFAKPCISDDLTREGRRILHKVDYDYGKYSEIREQVDNGGDILAFGKERCPTAYLFRRNFGEHLRDLGLTDAEIQYLMGHVLESDRRKRNDFTNPECLVKLSRKLENRPLLNQKSDTGRLESIGLCETYAQRFGGYAKELKIPCDGRTYIICLEGEEYHDTVDVTIKRSSNRKDLGPAQVTYYSMERQPGKNEMEQEVRDVSVLKDYIEAYGEDKKGTDEK